MDRPDLAPELHRGALGALSRINRLSLADGPLWSELVRGPALPLRVLDLACGGGDVTIRLALRAKREGLPITFAGCDRSDTALETARQRSARAGVDIHWFAADVLHDPLPEGFDVLMCSLFLHHLEEEEVVALLARMRSAARQLVLASDLRRSRVGYLLALGVSRLMTRSPVVQMDAPLSVRGAFTLREIRGLAAQAGLEGAQLSPRWPQRYLLSWRRPEGEGRR